MVGITRAPSGPKFGCLFGYGQGVNGEFVTGPACNLDAIRSPLDVCAHSDNAEPGSFRNGLCAETLRDKLRYLLLSRGQHFITQGCKAGARDRARAAARDSLQ